MERGRHPHLHRVLFRLPWSHALRRQGDDSRDLQEGYRHEPEWRADRALRRRARLVLLHGFPELAYSWRKVMLPLAAAGYHVIAPDQRGYGRTTGWDGSFEADPDPFRILNMVRDATGLVFALGYRSVAAVAGHDAGSPVASWCAL